MKISDFYEKYWIIKLPSGENINPKLTDRERKILNLSEELNVPPYIETRGRMFGCEVHPLIKEKL